MCNHRCCHVVVKNCIVGVFAWCLRALKTLTCKSRPQTFTLDSSIERKCLLGASRTQTVTLRYELKTQIHTFNSPISFQIIENGVVTNQAARQLWLLRDVTCRNYILATNEPNQKRNLYGLATAREMWTKIETQYASNASDIETSCLMGIYQIKFDQGNN